MNSIVQFKRRTEPVPTEIRSLSVRVPGSSANLGPGFDALALAYQLYCTLHFRILEKDDANVPLITLKGSQVEGLPTDQSNLIYTVLSDLLRKDAELKQRVRICIESEIPLGRGVGSSAAAITAAVWAGIALSGHAADDQTILSKACEIEGHADNAAASLLGGLVVSANSQKSKAVMTQKVKWPEEWATIVCVPSVELSTKKSRGVLPTQITRADAVHNLQHVALLMAALQNRDEEAMSEALHDRLHEPYRLGLVPQLGEIRKVVSDLPVIGCVLSGAGPSVLTIVPQRHKQQVMACLQEWTSKHAKQGKVLDLVVDQEGLKVSYE